MPYFRFCQTLEAIYKRRDKDRIFYAMVQETQAKFLATIIASTTALTEKGRMMLNENINKFAILGTKPPKSEKKELPVGGYEQAMDYFKGLEG